MSLLKKAARYFAASNFCRTALNEPVDFSSFRQKASSSDLLGLGLLILSYIIYMPVVIVLGTLAVLWREPLIGVIGIPLIYGITTVVFIIGLKLAGKKYVKAMASWFVQITLKKILRDEVKNYYVSQQAANPPEK